MDNILLKRNDVTMYNNIEITAKDSEFAQKYTFNIKDEFLRKKLFYTLSIASSARNYLNNMGFNFNLDDSLFQIEDIIENYEYVGIYSNNLPVHITYHFENELSVAVPKIHFEASIEPPMYLVAKLHSDLKSFDITGTINTNFLNKVKENTNYIYVDTASLNNINNLQNDINKFLSNFEVTKNCEIFTHIKTNFISFIDKNLTVTENVELIKHLSKCQSCRQKLLYYYKFESMIRNSDYNSDITNEIDRYINNPYFIPDINKEDADYDDNISNLKEDIIDNNNIIEDNTSIINNENYNEIAENNLVEKITEDDSKIIEKNEIPDALNNQDNSKLSILYDEAQTIKENIDEISTIEQSLKKKVVLPVILALIFGTLCYLGYNYYNKINNIADKQNYLHIVDDIPPENAAIDGQNIKTREVLVPRPLKLSQISWEAPEIVLKTPVYNKYLIDVGKNLKINLQTQFIELKEMVYQTKFQLQIIIDTNGSVADVKIIQASGNEVVDDLIVSTTKQTLNYIKPPIVETIKKPLILILEFEF